VGWEQRPLDTSSGETIDFTDFLAAITRASATVPERCGESDGAPHCSQADPVLRILCSWPSH